uniref:Apoptosis inhibitor 5-like protein API5 n=1 Tax=Fagus sylvatica TaxID=28930 RepID=A0A2N9J001_FAGSY
MGSVESVSQLYPDMWSMVFGMFGVQWVMPRLLSNVEELTRATMKKLTQGMAEHNKAMAAAKSDEAKDSIKTQKQNTTTGLRTCNNILAMTKPLHSKTPSFIGDKVINLSWKEATKPNVLATTTATGGKRPATAANGSSNVASKKGRGAGGLQNQLVNRALEGLSHGGRGGTRGRGRGWGGRGRGRGFR